MREAITQPNKMSLKQMVKAFFAHTNPTIPHKELIIMADFINQKHKTNRLIYEKSPYLLQHAHNPVDWFPWGPEAFQKAEKEHKPVFLSVGYS